MVLSELDLKVAENSLKEEWLRQHGHTEGFDDAKAELIGIVVANHAMNAIDNPGARFAAAREAAAKTIGDRKPHATLAKAMADARTKYIAAGGSEVDFEADKATIRAEILRKAAIADSDDEDARRAQTARTW